MKHVRLFGLFGLLGLLGVLTAACTTNAHVEASHTAETARFARVSRADFNRLAVELAAPIFWTEDKNRNGALDPNELAVYWGLVPGTSLPQYTDGRGFSSTFENAYENIVKRSSGHEPTATNGANLTFDAIDTIRAELAQGRITLVSTDLSKASSEEKRFVVFIKHAAWLIEKLYAKQKGVSEFATQLSKSSAAESRALFFRNQGPDCVAPRTENNPYCSAIPNLPKAVRSGLYPKDMLANPNFCDALNKLEKEITDPFTVVIGSAAAPKAVGYHEFYRNDMTEIAVVLRQAANALGTKEPALKAYLLADAQAFTDNQWWPADEAWAKMDATNSKYYLRIAPDEVYAEPCSTKALFHVSFGLINQSSRQWQTMLDPLKGEMEKAMREMAGPPYQVRSVTFKLPDFIDVALNAGDSRPPFGAAIGQSLPNFGPVANEGRGRTIAMTNFYTDPDSISALRDSSNSLFCKATMAKYTSDPEPQLMSTVLHEATHNLGPAHQYKVRGKIDREIFGGPLASTLEELKAQTGALFFTHWLAANRKITKGDAEKAFVRDLVWMFGHISRGMFDQNKHPRNYSQLAAIQLGWLMDHKAVAWHPAEISANGKDQGCFEIELAEFPAATQSLMRIVSQIKSQGDKVRAEKLISDYVDVTGDRKAIHNIITERVLRSPKASFVYSVKLD
ncbi:MAG: hypothetical protein FWD73_13320 [Polyangiaceae bacterium]|nr:hypothetical protein [Polyangiaceae bacterium]